MGQANAVIEHIPSFSSQLRGGLCSSIAKQSPAVCRAHGAREVRLSAGDTIVCELTLERVTVGRAQAAALAPSLISVLPTGAWGNPTPDTETLRKAREEHNKEHTDLQDLPDQQRDVRAGHGT